MRENFTAVEARLRGVLVPALIVVFALFTLPFLYHCAIRIGYATSIDFSEGWNVIHTARLLAGEALYPDNSGLPLAPVNYPPLSFLLVGGASYLTGDILFAGRVLAFGALLLVAYLIFATVRAATSSLSSGLLGALVWLIMVIQNASHFVGMYDPQLLGHAFTTAAFYYAVKWHGALDLKRVWIIAGLCCLGLFIKHMLVAVPLALAFGYLLADRKTFGHFALAGLGVSSLLFAGSWLYGGEHFLSNFIEFDRNTSHMRRLDTLLELLLVQSWWVLFVPFLLLLTATARKCKFGTALIYFAIALVLGAYFAGGIGVDKNAWFDFFIASAMVVGLAAATGSTMLGRLPAPLTMGAGLIFAGLVIGIYIGSFDLPGVPAGAGLRYVQFAATITGILLIINQRAAVLVGAALIGAGVMANEVLAARYLSADGALNVATVTTIRSSQLLLIASGIVLAARRWIRAGWERLGARINSGLVNKPGGLRTWGAALWLYAVVALGLVPIFMDLSLKLGKVPSRHTLERLAHAYEQDVELLKSIAGPALFEDLLLGFAAGKELYFDPFAGAVLISSGRVPEEALTGPVARRYFAVIVIKSRPEGQLAADRRSAPAAIEPRDYFNGSLLGAIEENYELLDRMSEPENYLFYVPRSVQTAAQQATADSWSDRAPL